MVCGWLALPVQVGPMVVMGKTWVGMVDVKQRKILSVLLVAFVVSFLGVVANKEQSFKKVFSFQDGISWGQFDEGLKVRSKERALSDGGGAWYHFVVIGFGAVALLLSLLSLLSLFQSRLRNRRHNWQHLYWPAYIGPLGQQQQLCHILSLEQQGALLLCDQTHKKGEEIVVRVAYQDSDFKLPEELFGVIERSKPAANHHHYIWVRYSPRTHLESQALSAIR